MFEQYTDVELKRIAWETDNSDMKSEYFCRETAEEYKNMDDREISAIISKRMNARLIFKIKSSGKVNVGPIYVEHLFIELRRRQLKRKGVVELPIEIIYSDEEQQMFWEASREEREITRLEKEIENEKNTQFPNLEKIKKHEEEIEKLNGKINALYEKLY
jgi:hypothetical protein